MTKLTYEERKDLPTGEFVFPKTRRYPIEDAAHARDALARSSGKPEHAAVAAAVSASIRRSMWRNRTGAQSPLNQGSANEIQALARLHFN